jgi:hypothetical protein
MNVLEEEGIKCDPVDELHCTLMYSAKEAPHSIRVSKLLNEGPFQFKATPEKLEFWPGHDQVGYVVLKMSSRDLQARFNQYVDLGCEHSFPDYQAHMTIASHVTSKPKCLTELNKELCMMLPIKFSGEHVEDIKNASESAVGLDRFYWMRYVGTSVKRIRDTDNVQHPIQPKDVFGVREVKGKDYDEVVLSDGTRIKLSIPKSESLMNASKEFRGKVPTVKAKKAPTKPTPMQAVTKIPVKKAKVNKTTKEHEVQVKTSRPSGTTPKTKVIIALNGKAKVTRHISDVDFPEVEDFTDSSIPSEYRRYTGESSARPKVKR